MESDERVTWTMRRRATRQGGQPEAKPPRRHQLRRGDCAQGIGQGERFSRCRASFVQAAALARIETASYQRRSALNSSGIGRSIALAAKSTVTSSAMSATEKLSPAA